MRCKNCGTENDDSRYICETCGSPLYDEDEIGTGQTDDNDSALAENEDEPPSKLDDKTKKSIIIIAVLCLILVALIAGIVFAVNAAKKDPNNLSEPSSDEGTSDISEITTKPTTKITTTKKKTTTSKPTTTKPTTTEPTTQPSTNTTYNVYIDTSGYGSATGDGEYKKGEKAILTAYPDSGYVFDGWYNDSGALLDSSTRYSFTVKKDTSVKAVFKSETPLEMLDGNND